MGVEEDWISFSGFRGLAKWLLDSKVGQRFVAWFVRRHYKQLLSGTDWGHDFYDWILAKAANDLSDRNPIVVVELSPDLVKGGGVHVRVFGSIRCSVHFVDRLVVPNTAEAERLDLELAYANAPFRVRGVYPRSKYLLKSHCFEPVDPVGYAARELERDVSEKLGKYVRGKS